MYLKFLLTFTLTYFLNISNVLAYDSGIFGPSIDSDDIRRGNIHLDDIPNIIVSSIDFFLGIAGTIAVIFIIIGAYKILKGGFTGDKGSKGKETIIMAITGFAIAALAWFIVKFVFVNLG